MRLLATLFVFTLMIWSCATPEKKEDTSAYQSEVEAAVEQLRQQLVNPEESVLKGLTSDILTYGHSNGVIEDQSEFIASLISGKFKFVSLELSEQTVQLSGETAIVRHRLFGNTADAGKDPGTANLKVMQVWQKQGGEWKLLSRQAVKILQ